MSCKILIDCGAESCAGCQLLTRKFHAGGDYTLPVCKLFSEALAVKGGRDLAKFWVSDDDVVLRSAKCRAFEASQPSVDGADEENSKLELRIAHLELRIAQHIYDDEMTCESEVREGCTCCGCQTMAEREKIDWVDRPAEIKDLIEAH